MELFLPIGEVLWIASLVAEALVVVRFLRQGLLRAYPFFVVSLTVELAGALILLHYDLKSSAYVAAYRICQPTIAIFHLGVTAELYERICKHFPGIGIFRAVLASVLILLTALVAVLTFRPNLIGPWALPIGVMTVLIRIQDEVLAGVLLLTWLFLRFVAEYPPAVPPKCIDPLDYCDRLFRGSGSRLPGHPSAWRAQGDLPH